MKTFHRWLRTIAAVSLLLPAAVSAAAHVIGPDSAPFNIEAVEHDGGLIDITVVMGADLPFARSGLLNLSGLSSGVDLIGATSSAQFPGAVTVFVVGGKPFTDSPFVEFGINGADLKAGDAILVWQLQLSSPGLHAFGLDVGGSIDTLSPEIGEGQLLADPPAHFDLTISAVPEPNAALLVGVGLAFLAFVGIARANTPAAR